MHCISYDLKRKVEKPLLFKQTLKSRFTCLASLLAEVSHDEAKVRERRETLSFLSFLPRRERPLLAGKCLACQHFSFDAKKSLDRERPFSLALRVVSLFSCLSRLAPSVTRVAIACLAFCSTDYRKNRDCS